MGAQLQIGHIGCDLRTLGGGFIAHDHGVGTGKRGIADVLEFLQFHIREHTDIHGVFHVDPRADAACDIDLIDHIHGHVHALQKGINGGEDGALCPDEVVDVHLVDGNLSASFGFFSSGDYIAAHVMGIPLHPTALPDKQALGVDHATAVQLGDNIDDAGATDTHRFLTGITNNG